MSDFLELAKLMGLPAALLLVAIVALWRERVAERAKLLENLEARAKAAEAESAQLHAELKAMQKEQLRDAQEFLAALERKRAPNSPP
jgi:hypothetical protein